MFCLVLLRAVIALRVLPIISISGCMRNNQGYCTSKNYVEAESNKIRGNPDASTKLVDRYPSYKLNKEIYCNLTASVH